MSEASTRELNTDLLIIGSGAAGLAAAIEAASQGVRVTVIDGAPSWGGTARVSGGGCCLVDTPFQRQLGIEDSLALATKDWYD